ncbi:MAG TPA: hypothetical protein PK858_06890, partial [Saprospiraceae bacterium]|nr:hypothetical protein [Saprospiraceae bacterium]
MALPSNPWQALWARLPAPLGVEGDESFDAVGSALDAWADLDGDGAADLVLGSWRTEAVLLFAGPLTGALAPGDADARLTGAGAPYGWGGLVQTLDDLDGDSLP